MAKSAKAKKAKKADFSKVKLKVGKRLPKGQNATETSFKSRKIVIAQQHKTVTVSAASPAGLSFKELTNRIRNSGGSTRADGLEKLRTLLASDSSLVSANLGVLITLLGSILMTEDDKTRQRAQSLVLHVVGMVSESQLSAFFECLVTHVTCAMTHLDCDVRKTGVDVLGGLLERCPGLLITAADRLLPCLLEQVSGGSSSKLLDNPNLRLSAFTWRVNVLSHLANLLQALRPEQADTAVVEVRRFSQSGRHFSIFDRPRSSNPASESCHLLSDPDRLKRFSRDAISGLNRCYAEVTSDLKSDPSLLSPDAAQMLAISLRIIVSLLDHIERSDVTNDSALMPWFTKNCAPDIYEKILRNFPFCPATARNRQSPGKNAGISASANCYNANASVCNLVAKLFAGKPESYDDLSGKVLNYITQTLQDDSGVSKSENLSLALFSLLKDDSIDVEERETCVDAAACHFSTSSAADRGIGLSLFTHLTTDHQLAALATRDAVCLWSRALLDSVARSPSRNPPLLAALCRLASMGHPGFLTQLERVAPALLASLQTVDDTEPFEWQQSVVNLVYWIRQSPEVKEALGTLLNRETSSPIDGYVRSVLVSN